MKAASALRAAGAALRSGARSIGGAPKVRLRSKAPLSAFVPRRPPDASARATPQLACNQVALTVVDPHGRRFPVFGLVGRTLAEALAGASHPELRGATVHLSPSHGPEGHVRVAHEYAQHMEPLDAEGTLQLHYLAEDIAEDSRLASKARAVPHPLRVRRRRAAPLLRRCCAHAQGGVGFASRRGGSGRGRTRAAHARVAGRVVTLAAPSHAPKRLGASDNAALQRADPAASSCCARSAARRSR